MRKKQYVLFNPAWIGAIAVAVMFMARFLDFTVADEKRWALRPGPMGFAISISIWSYWI